MTDATKDFDISTVNFGDEAINELAKGQNKLRTDCWYQAYVTEGEFEISKNEAKKGLQFKLSLVLLEEEGNASKIGKVRPLNKWVNTPWNALAPAASSLEEAERKQKALAKLDMMVSDLYALFGAPTFKEVPRREKGSKGGYVYEDGTKATKAEYEEALISARKGAMEWARVQCQKKSGKEFRGCAPYVKVVYENGSEFPSVSQMRNTLPPGENFTPASQALVSVQMN